MKGQQKKKTKTKTTTTTKTDADADVDVDAGAGWLSLRDFLRTITPLAYVAPSDDNPAPGENELPEMMEHLLRLAAVVDPTVYMEVVDEANSGADLVSDNCRLGAK